jgi:transcriptional regulator with XRE-family HTH domain
VRSKRLDFVVIYLSEIETGKKHPSLTMLATIAAGFSITLSKLLDGL